MGSADRVMPTLQWEKSIPAPFAEKKNAKDAAPEKSKTRDETTRRFAA